MPSRHHVRPACRPGAREGDDSGSCASSPSRRARHRSRPWRRPVRGRRNIIGDDRLGARCGSRGPTVPARPRAPTPWSCAPGPSSIRSATWSRGVGGLRQDDEPAPRHRRFPLRRDVPVRVPDLAVDPLGARADRTRHQLAFFSLEEVNRVEGKKHPGSGLVLRLVHDAVGALLRGATWPSSTPGSPRRAGPPRGGPQAHVPDVARRSRRARARPGLGRRGHRRPSTSEEYSPNTNESSMQAASVSPRSSSPTGSASSAPC